MPAELARSPVLRWLAAFKIAYFVLLTIALAIFGDLDTHMFYAVNARWPRAGGPTFASHFATWDAAHYLYLTEVGYHAGSASCAFYPLWPLLVRWVSSVCAVSPVLVGILLSNLCSLAAFVVFHCLVARRWGKMEADWSTAFLIAFPGSLFFQFNYTESLFLLISLILWWGLEESRTGWIWAAACLLPLTRPIGVFAVLPIAWDLSEKGWRSFRQGLTLNADRSQLVACIDLRRINKRFMVRTITFLEANGRHLATSIAAEPLWLIAAPLLGWILYLTLIWSWTGNPFEGFAAQKYWGVNSIRHLWSLRDFVVQLFTLNQWHGYRGSMLDRSVFLLLLYCLPSLWHMDKGMLVWTYILGIAPAMSGMFVSFTRYASCAFPVFIALGVALRGPRSRWPRRCLFAIFAVLHVSLLWRFVNFRWAG